MKRKEEWREKKREERGKVKRKEEWREKKSEKEPIERKVQESEGRKRKNLDEKQSADDFIGCVWLIT